MSEGYQHLSPTVSMARTLFRSAAIVLSLFLIVSAIIFFPDASERRGSIAVGTPIVHTGKDLGAQQRIGGFAVDHEGAIIVAYDDKLTSFSQQHTIIDFTKKAKFKAPLELAGVAISPQGDLYVVDRGNYLILKTTKDGAQTSTIDLNPFSPYGPNGLAIGNDGNLYVADTGRNRILVLNQNGQLVKELASGLGLKQPFCIAIDSQSNLYVSDMENKRLLGIDANGKMAFTVALDFQPKGIALDEQQLIYVPNPDATELLVYDRAGQLIGRVDLENKGATEIEGIQYIQITDGQIVGTSQGTMFSDDITVTLEQPQSQSSWGRVPLILLGIAFLLLPTAKSRIWSRCFQTIGRLRRPKVLQ